MPGRGGTDGLSKEFSKEREEERMEKQEGGGGQRVGGETASLGGAEGLGLRQGTVSGSGEAGPAWTDGVPGRRAGETEGALASPHTYGQVPLPSHQQGRGWRKALLRTRSCLCGREGLEAGGQPEALFPCAIPWFTPSKSQEVGWGR